MLLMKKHFSSRTSSMMAKESVSSLLFSRLATRYSSYQCNLTQLYIYILIFHIAVYIYVYLNGQTVNYGGGGTIINWTPT